MFQTGNLDFFCTIITQYKMGTNINLYWNDAHSAGGQTFGLMFHWAAFIGMNGAPFSAHIHVSVPWQRPAIVENNKKIQKKSWISTVCGFPLYTINTTSLYCKFWLEQLMCRLKLHLKVHNVTLFMPDWVLHSALLTFMSFIPFLSFVRWVVFTSIFPPML